MSAVLRVSLLRQVSASTTPAAMVVARVCRLERSTAQALVTRLGVLPRAFDEAEATALVEQLRVAGVEAQTIPGPATAARRCGVHPSLEATSACRECGASMCTACVLEEARPQCQACLGKERRRLAFRNVRVAVLLVFLGGVGLWALSRQLRLDRRTTWARPLTVSVVLVTQGEPNPALIPRWEAATDALTEWFTGEWARYRAPGAQPPVRFVLEKVARVEALPVAPEDTQGTVAFERQLNEIDAQVGVRRNDATVYVALSGGGEASQRVEGIGEAGGRRGLIYADVNATEVTLESVALAHEVLHCLGARDKYDAQGHAAGVAGLVAPEQVPLYPQPGGEVMVGEVATGPNSGEPIRSLREVHVGPATAREIRW